METKLGLSPKRIKQISILLTITALGLWSQSVLAARFEVGHLGLISGLPGTFFIAFGLLALASAILWMSEEKHGKLLGLQLVLLVAALWLVPLITGGSPAFLNHGYRNLGFVDYIARNGDFGSIWYLNWPGAFIVPAMLVKVGTVNFEPILAITPLFLNLLYLLPLYLFLKNTLGEGRSNYVWAGCWLFSLAQWTGQDYFSSSQGAAFFLLLTLLALITSPPIWQRGFNALSLRLMIVVVFAALVTTHLLTSLAALSILAGFSVVRWDKRMALVLLACLVLLAAWSLTETKGFAQNRLLTSEGVTLVQPAPEPSEVVTEEEIPGEGELPTGRGRPAVRTWEADKITTKSARLRGNLVKLGMASSVDVSYEWGTTTGYGNETPVLMLDLSSSFQFILNDLSPGTTYHYRTKAVGKGTSYGTDRTFTTSGVPPPVRETPAGEVAVPRGLLILNPEVLVDREITGHISGSASHADIAIFRIIFPALFTLIGLAGFIVAFIIRRSFRDTISLLVITLAPLALVTLSGNYGREILVRIYLFALPGMAYFGARLLDIRSKLPAIILALVLIVSVPLHVIAHYGNQELDYISPAQLSGLEFFHDQTSRGVNFGAWNLGTMKNIEHYQWARIPLEYLEWEGDSLVSYTGKRDLPSYIGISRQNKARYGWFEGNTELIEGIERSLADTVNYNFFYNNPDLKLYISQNKKQKG